MYDRLEWWKRWNGTEKQVTETRKEKEDDLFKKDKNAQNIKKKL